MGVDVASGDGDGVWLWCVGVDVASGGSDGVWMWLVEVV